MGLKKCTRDVREVTAVLIGSKKCVLEGVWLLFEFVGTRDSVGYSLRSWVQKNIPAMLSVTLCVCGFKKMHRDVSEVTAVFIGSKKCVLKGVWLLFEFVGTRGQS